MAPDMPGMARSLDPWALPYLLPALVMWLLMMVAMMLPSAVPMILLHARIDRGTETQRARHSALFVGTYLAVWMLFSVLAAVTQAALIDSGLLTAGDLRITDRYLAAGLLVGAGVWQLTSAKAMCLERCQSPIHFVMRYWSLGLVGAARLGLIHGVYCLGCCWSLMLLLFAGGVMNLAIIAGLAAIVFFEKLAPPPWRFERWVAVLLFVAAGVVLIA